MRLRRALAQSLVFLAISACGGSTIGELVNLPFAVGGVPRDPTQPLVFTSALGWTINLQTALIYLGPFYFNVDAPQTSTYRSGLFLLQSTNQVLVNALDPTLYPVDGGANGETGVTPYAEIELYPADITQIDPTQLDAGPTVAAVASFWSTGQQALVQGVATKLETPAEGGAPVEWWVNFTGFVQIDQSFANASDPLVWQERIQCEACYFPDGGLSYPDGGGCALNIANQPEQLILRVDPTHWFDDADFNDLIPAILLNPPVVDAGPPVDAGAPVDAGPAHKIYTANFWQDTSQFNQALVQGVQSRNGVYNFSLVPLTSP